MTFGHQLPTNQTTNSSTMKLRPQDHEDRLRPAPSGGQQTKELTRAGVSVKTNKSTNSSGQMEQVPLKFKRLASGTRALGSKFKAINCSLPIVLLIILSNFNHFHHNHRHQRPHQQLVAEAQFLFTYEINQESDESRVPRSSLFDPSSFKIVTPSQLQSSYQKLASQQPGQIAQPPREPLTRPQQPLASVALTQETGAAGGGSVESQQFGSLVENSTPAAAAAAAPSASPTSFLKQTSAAIQSFAELFHLTPSSSPAPLAAVPNAAGQSSALDPASGIDQQAEVRSLHEHWTQQQQRAHNQAGQVQPQVSAFQSFTTSPTVQTNLASHNHHHQQPQQKPGGPQASYWLTSSPLNAPDGNFLVEIKNAADSNGQQQQHQVQNLLQQQQVAPSGQLAPTSAQSSFLATPTSSAHFGLPATKPRPAAAPIQPASHQLAPTPIGEPHFESLSPPTAFRKQNFQPQSQAPHQHQARSLSHSQQHQTRASSTPNSRGLFQSDLLDTSHGQLQPPVNAPLEHLAEHNLNSGSNSAASAASISGQLAPLKSAEESLMAYRQQQQHDQQNAFLAGQNQFVATQTSRPAASNAEQPTGASNSLADDELAPGHQHEHNHNNHHHQHRPETRQRLPAGGLASNTYQAVGPMGQPPKQTAPVPASEVPKVSPQIYESFLLQQKDQYEKHMELLKQQQELNKLLEQKQKQQQAEEAADKRKRAKKAELERVEARKKANAAREQEQQVAAARKARQEAEEARRKQQRLADEEAAKRRRQADEERRYRELVEAREREEADRRRQEAEKLAAAAEAARRQREQQERELVLEQQNRRRKQQEQEAAEEAAKQQQQLRDYLKEQEELRKLLELKQKEDEAAAQARQRQAQQQSGAAGRSSSSSRANKLAAEHRDRARQTAASSTGSHQTASSHWGGRQTRVRASTFEPNSAPADQAQVAPSTSTAPTTTTTTSSSAPATSGASSSAASSRARFSGGLRRLKTTDEKLIRQKIPLYSGAGKYGLYRSDSNSEELAKLLEAVTLPPSSTSTTTTTTTTTTRAPASATNSAASDLLDPATEPREPANRSPFTSSSLSPLLNLSEFNSVSTPPSSPQARATTDEPLSSTTVFDDDVPRRPVAATRTNSPVNGRLSRGNLESGTRDERSFRLSFPAPMSPAASSSSPSRTVPQPAGGGQQQLINRMGSSSTNGTTATTSSHSGRSGASIGLASLPADSDNDGIPGRAGREYPVLAEVPPTSFSCSRMKLSGFFADTETACQVVHLCQDGVQSSILCPNGTIFNQEKFSCQWWYEVNCARAPMFYQLNDNLYKSALNGNGAKDEVGPSVELNKRARSQTTTPTNNLMS